MLSKIGEEIAKLKKSDEEKAICSSYSQQPANVSLSSTSFQSDNEKAIYSSLSQQSQAVSQPSTSYQTDKAIYSFPRQPIHVLHPTTSIQSDEGKAICSSLSQKPSNVSQLSANSQYTVFDLDSKSYSFNQNNHSGENIQSRSSNLLTNSQFVDVGEDQESYYSYSDSPISGKSMFLYLYVI